MKRVPVYVVVASTCLLVAQSSSPTPLYPLYTERWDFSPLTSTLVFSIYIAGLALTLVTAGSLSDHIGRKRVVVTALGAAAAAMLVLMTADGLGSLLLGRALQGVSAGLGFGTLGAALFDHTPASKHRSIAVLNGALPPIALGIGTVLTGLLVEFLPHPFSLTYSLLFVLLLVAIAASLMVEDRNEPRPGAWRSLVPVVHCPPAVRGRLVVAAMSLCASWALAGLYLGIGPTITHQLFDVSSPTVAGLVVFLVTGSGGLIGLVTARLTGSGTLWLGAAGLVVGSGLMSLAVATGNLAVFVSASIIGGIGYGAAFQGGLAAVVGGTSPEERGGVLSLLYLISYTAFGLPTLVAGLLIPHLGLAAVVDTYAAFVAALAIGAIGSFVWARNHGVFAPALGAP